MNPRGGTVAAVRRQDHSAASANCSVVITAHDESEELQRTLRSLHRSSRASHELILVDDGTSQPLSVPPGTDHVLRHERRAGVAASRHEAALLASGDVIAFADAHQRFTRDCYDSCAAVAIQRQAVVSPTVRGFGWLDSRFYGARFRLCPEHGYFKADWITKKPRAILTEHTSLKGPGYCIPRDLYLRLAWSPLLRGWGGSEAWITLKAFFQRIPILYLRGPIAYHRFRKKFPYKVTWDEIWRNQALLARVVFDERTWRHYWLPELFAAHLSPKVIAEMDSPAVVAEHEAFQPQKSRPDREFWEVLLGQDVPPQLA